MHRVLGHRRRPFPARGHQAPAREDGEGACTARRELGTLGDDAETVRHVALPSPRAALHTAAVFKDADGNQFVLSSRAK
jgi:hypothetical protein